MNFVLDVLALSIKIKYLIHFDNGNTIKSYFKSNGSITRLDIELYMGIIWSFM